MQDHEGNCCALFHEQFYIIKKFEECYVSTFLNDEILNKLISKFHIIK